MKFWESLQPSLKLVPLSPNTYGIWITSSMCSQFHNLMLQVSSFCKLVLLPSLLEFLIYESFCFTIKFFFMPWDKFLDQSFKFVFLLNNWLLCSLSWTSFFKNFNLLFVYFCMLISLQSLLTCPCLHLYEISLISLRLRRWCVLHVFLH